jgi:hypothetical protein
MCYIIGGILLQTTRKPTYLSVLSDVESRNGHKPYQTPLVQELGSISELTFATSIDFNIS